ncbi:MAG: hypothetical protein MZV64_15765 [Ignavibacteriales bacterium]|nr:hypothetical protein [Ignavibacteriales bacterium]
MLRPAHGRRRPLRAGGFPRETRRCRGPAAARRFRRRSGPHLRCGCCIPLEGRGGDGIGPRQLDICIVRILRLEGRSGGVGNVIGHAVGQAADGLVANLAQGVDDAAVRASFKGIREIGVIAVSSLVSSGVPPLLPIASSSVSASRISSAWPDQG